MWLKLNFLLFSSLDFETGVPGAVRTYQMRPCLDRHNNLNENRTVTISGKIVTNTLLWEDVAKASSENLQTDNLEYATSSYLVFTRP